MKNDIMLPLAIATVVFLYVCVYQPKQQKKEGYCGCGK